VELIAAIDLQEGRVVRLLQGDFERSTTYGTDPVEMAVHWVREGASRLHLVDLDGAREGMPRHGDVIARVVASVPIPCEVAGGLRDEASVERALASGAARVALGSALLRDPALGERLVRRFGPGAIVAAIDVRGDTAVGDGWTSGATGSPVAAAVDALADAGVRLFAVTAIARDGSLDGPDLALLDAVAERVGPASVIASGGIRDARDIAVLAGRGFAGAILGRALYEGTLTLHDARAAVASAAPPRA
jgi:phosphoribosylformimino-5-aminoimidazole carboxamide ribotide isomerase